MKKLLILLAVSALCVSYSFSDNDTPPIDENLLVGKWYLSNGKGYSSFNGERENFNDSYTKENTWIHWDLSTDGTLTANNIEVPTDSIGSTDKWYVSGRIFTIEYEDGAKEKSTIKSLTATTLILFAKGKDEDAPYEHTLTFTKIN